MRRVVNPDPAWFTVWDDAPAPKMRSFEPVTVAEPLFMAWLEPIAAAEASSGLVASTPEYSWM